MDEGCWCVSQTLSPAGSDGQPVAPPADLAGGPALLAGHGVLHQAGRHLQQQLCS